MKKKILLLTMIMAAVLVLGMTVKTEAKVGKVKKISVTSLAKYGAKKATITVKWSKVKGASKYSVYRATKKNGKYKKIKTVKKTKYTDKKKKGTFYYKVRAHAGSSKGSFSAKKGTCTVSGRFVMAATTTFFYGPSFRSTRIELKNLAKGSLYIQTAKNLNNIVAMKSGKKQIDQTWSGEVGDKGKALKVKEDFGMSSGLYYGDAKDLYIQLTVTKTKKKSPSFVVWINMGNNDTYVEEGKGCKKSSLFKTK